MNDFENSTDPLPTPKRACKTVSEFRFDADFLTDSLANFGKGVPSSISDPPTDPTVPSSPSPRAVVTPGSPVLSATSLFSFFLLFLSTYEVASDDEDLVKRHGFKRKKRDFDHPHDLAATARELAELLVLKAIFEKYASSGRKLKLNDYYGSNRFGGLLSKMRKAAMVHFKCTGKQINGHFSFGWYRPLITAKDNQAYSHMVEKFPSFEPTEFTEIVMTDVYQVHPKDLLKYKNCNFWVIQQQFDSDVAGVNFKSSPYFVKDERVYQRSDQRSTTWCTHPFENVRAWQEIDYYSQKDIPESASWTVWRSVLDYNILHGTITCFTAEVMAPKTHKYSGIVKIPGVSFLEYWWLKFLCLLPIVEVSRYFTYYDKYVLMSVAQDIMAVKPYNNRSSYQYTAIAGAVNNAMGRRYDELFLFWHIEKSRVVRDTVDYILFSSIRVEAQSLSNNLDAVSDQLGLLRKIKGNLYESENYLRPFLNISLILIVTALISWCFSPSLASAELMTEEVPPFFEPSWTDCRYYIAIFRLLYREIMFLMTVLTIIYKYRYVIISWLWFFLGPYLSLFSTPLGNYWTAFQAVHAKLQQHITSYSTFRELYENQNGKSYEGPSFGGFIMTLPPTVFKTDKEQKHPDTIHVLLGTKAMMYQPAGRECFYEAYELRNRSKDVMPRLSECEDVHKCSSFRLCDNGPRPKCLLNRAWMEAADVTGRVLKRRSFLPFSLHMRDTKLSRDQWAERMAGAHKKYRARRANEMKREGVTDYRSDCFLKGDEVLWPKEKKDGSLCIKPRVVQAVAPHVQSVCGPIISDFMAHLKMHVFNKEKIYSMDGYQKVDPTITFTIGSGMTSDELSDWFTYCYTDLETLVEVGGNHYHCIVAGDDFFAMGRENGAWTFIENDFSKYDRTQGVHALGAEFLVLDLLGLPPKVLATLEATLQNTPTYQDRKLDTKVRMSAPVQRFTGGPDTTLGNSINNIIAVLYDLAGKYNILTLGSLSDLGFECKTHFPRLECGPTFLKGWWVPLVDRSEWRWVPLPSQMLKLGKILTNPSSIFPSDDALTAHKKAAKGMALSYSCVPDEYPILGPFLVKCRNLVEEDVEVIGKMYKDQIRGHCPGKLDPDFVYGLMASRYGLSREDIEKLEAEILQAEFPCILADDGFVVLGERDYA